MDFTKMKDYEVQGLVEDAPYWIAKGEQDARNGTLHGRTPAQHAEVLQDWQYTLAGASQELTRRQQSA